MSNVKELKRLRDKYFQCAWSLKGGLRSVVYVDPSDAELNKISNTRRKFDKKFADVVGTAIKKAVKEVFDLAIKEAEVKQAELNKYKEKAKIKEKSILEFIQKHGYATNKNLHNIFGCGTTEAIKSLFDDGEIEYAERSNRGTYVLADKVDSTILGYIRSCDGVHTSEIVNKFGNVTKTQSDISFLEDEGAIYIHRQLWHARYEDKSTLTELVMEFMRDGVTTAMIFQEFGGRGLVIHTTLKNKGEIYQHHDNLWYNKPEKPLVDTVLDYIKKDGAITEKHFIEKFGKQKLWILQSLREDGLLTHTGRSWFST